MRLVDLTPMLRDIVIESLSRKRSGRCAHILPYNLKANELGTILARAINITMARTSPTEPVNRLLYALETIWAERVG